MAAAIDDAHLRTCEKDTESAETATSTPRIWVWTPRLDFPLPPHAKPVRNRS